MPEFARILFDKMESNLTENKIESVIKGVKGGLCGVKKGRATHYKDVLKLIRKDIFKLYN